MTAVTTVAPHLNTQQLASRWAVTPGHLMNLRSAGQGPPYLKLGARVVYRLEDLEAYEAARVVLPAEERAR